MTISPLWDNVTTTDAGAVTWCSATAGCTGVVTTTNSLVGTTTGDQVGGFGATALSNGNYVVSSPFWSNGAVTNAGAVTWCSGTVGCTGVVTTINSLVGSTTGDQVGTADLIALSNGNYVVSSPNWHNGATTDAGAVTLGSGAAGVVGTITADNSVRGTAASGGGAMVVADDSVNDQVVVGHPADNIVSLLGPYKRYMPLVARH